jgi:hypothetical protein
MTRQASDRRVIAPGEIAPVRALDLDDSRPEISEVARGERGGNGLFDGNDRDAVEWEHDRRDRLLAAPALSGR